MIQIKRWDNGAVLFEFNESNGFKDGMTLRYAVEKAVALKVDLSYADLSGANLRYAKLIGADLRCANLSGADLFCANLRYVKLIGAYVRDAKF